MMKSIRFLIVLIICAKISYTIASNETSNIDPFKYLNNPKGIAMANEPVENLNVRECSLDITIHHLTCNCTVNYPKVINLIRNGSDWVRKGIDFPCTYADPKQTHKVYFFATNKVIEGTCNTPQERLEFFHTCAIHSGLSKATCYCTYNYPKKVTLKCSKGIWFMDNFQQQCRGTATKTTKVDLSSYEMSSRINNICDEPEVLLNIYHSCEKKQYPAKETSCWCTYNQQQKINFICYKHQYRGLTWIRNGADTPCKYNFNPIKVHCFNVSETIVCNCIKNCLNLDLKANLSYSEIDEICSRTVYFNYNQELKLSSYFDDNSFEFQCRRGYKLNGYRKLSCNFGILNGTLPQCIKIETNNDSSNVDVISFISWCFIAQLLIDIAILIFVIIYLLDIFKKLNGPPISNLNEEVNSNEVQTTQF